MHFDFKFAHPKKHIMLQIRKRYLELKEKATQLMLEGKMNAYLKTLTEIEQLNLILIKVK
jgi:hypothetical protein